MVDSDTLVGRGHYPDGKSHCFQAQTPASRWLQQGTHLVTGYQWFSQFWWPRSEVVNVGEPLSEFWALTKEEDSNVRADTKICHSHKVTNIFTWLQCYVSMLAPLYPEHMPELMAYIIIHTTQVWLVGYDSAFQRQAALNDNTR